MCTISDKLTLCSCKTKNVEQLKNYWILKRPTENACLAVGIMLLPAEVGAEADKMNQKTIRKQLNQGDCFDVALQHQEGDILELHFTCKHNPVKSDSLDGHGDFLAYAFQFKNGKWKTVEYDPHECGFDEVQKGKILLS